MSNKRKLSQYSSKQHHYSLESLVGEPIIASIVRDPIEGVVQVTGFVQAGSFRVLAVGTAKKHPRDRWDEEIGDALAIARFLETAARVLYDRASVLISED